MRRFLLFFIGMVCAGSVLAQKTSYRDNAQRYVEKYRQLAMEEQQRVGIPASITLGQGILETQAGQSELAINANNHFGIKCKKEWKGETYAYTDDAPNECFRKYPDDISSYRDHSDYLKNSKRYLPCFACGPNDYVGWAKALRQCGYATNPNYAKQLIKIIEDFQLQQYTEAAANAKQPILVASLDSPVSAATLIDQAKAGENIPETDQQPATPKVEYGVLTKKNGIRGFYAKKHDVLLEYAIKYKVRYAKLLEINRLPDAPLAKDQFIALERGSTSVEHILAKDASVPEAPVAAPTSQMPAPPPVVTNHPTLPIAPATPVEATPVVAKAVEAPLVIEQNTPETTPVVPNASINEAPETTAQQAAILPKDLAEKAAPTQDVSATAINIANEKSVEEMQAAKAADPVKEAEPQDEFSRLKARFDRVVYATGPTPTPSETKVDTTPKATSEPKTESAIQYHIVSKGETAFGIAKKYGISMTELMQLNHLNFESIKVGQKLRVH
ncbi:MAG: glucosaminidase domain-containing protein [Bacteroidetes bacterium]|nr:glucosaminidase domain-containing protein [Bacteroidota bacterium]